MSRVQKGVFDNQENREDAGCEQMECACNENNWLWAQYYGENEKVPACKFVQYVSQGLSCCCQRIKKAAVDEVKKFYQQNA